MTRARFVLSEEDSQKVRELMGPWKPTLRDRLWDHVPTLVILCFLWMAALSGLLVWHLVGDVHAKGPAAPPPQISAPALTPLTVPPVDGATIRGMDVSRYQTEVDFGEVKEAGLRYVFIKASEGANEEDPYYLRHLAYARQAQLAVGAYHFYRTDVSGQAQFDNFSRRLQVRAGDLPPVVDIEILATHTRPSWRMELGQMLSQLEARYGVKPILYSGSSFANEYLNDFSRYPLWIAEYGVKAPRIPPGFQQWTFWQYSPACTVAGVKGPVDCDRFAGSAQAFDALRIPSLPEVP